MVTRTFGVFAVDRGIFDHSFFASEPFTEREAWLWMISAAAWKTTRVRAGCKMVWLVRGQLMFSERFLAERWQWPKSTVRRFIHRLESEAMVATLSDHHSTLIIICNYEKYAFGGAGRGPVSDHEADHARTTKRTKEEESKNLRIKEEESVASAPPAAKRSKRKPMTTIPDNFILTGPRVQVAVAKNLDAEATFQDMRRKALHRQTTSADWDIYWVIWCEKQSQINRERPQGRGIAFAINEDGSPVHRDE